ncbi:MAG TPA: hypothetical protein VD866_30210 [Urbifossiella sp.]|nr:hypothetical protein [Urbifossiella sp.]
MADQFSTHRPGLASPYEHAAEITTHNTNELATYCRAIYVGGSGNLRVTTVRGDTITLTGVVVGTIIPVRAKVVFATGTTATNLVALW